MMKAVDRFVIIALRSNTVVSVKGGQLEVILDYLENERWKDDVPEPAGLSDLRAIITRRVIEFLEEESVRYGVAR